MIKTGSCHCGKVKFEADLQLENAISCNCSICHVRGTLLTFVSDENFKLISGEKDLTDYQFGKKRIHHYFCSTCGTAAFASAVKPDGTRSRAINIRCLDGVDIDSVSIKKFDGRSL